MKSLWRKTLRIGIVLLVASGTLLILILVLHATLAAPASASSPLVLAEYQAWHGLPSHRNPPYTSTDSLVIARHIQAAKAMSISGFVVDWYGPPSGLSNDTDRGFIDQATAELLRQSAEKGFHVALMYDEGTISNTEALTTNFTTRMISDLLYARQYFTAPAYLDINGHPALFVFPYTQVDPYINWSHVRSQLGISITLLDEDPNPDDPEHDAHFDGFYAWVQPTASKWLTDGTEWGQGYLTWFYNVMTYLAPTYTSKVAVGGVWPGFDDSQAAWGQGRYIWPRCGQTWRDTWRLASERNPPIVMIDTWNDFEESTDIEFGTKECLTLSHAKGALPGQQVVYTHNLSNTGKFTDIFQMTAQSSNAWPIVVSAISTTLISHTATLLTITLMVPATVSGGTQDMLIITATSQLSPSVYSSLTDTTTVLYAVYLPVVFKDQVATHNAN